MHCSLPCSLARRSSAPSNREDAVVFDSHEQRIMGLDPGFEYFRRLVAQPSPQNGSIVVMIGGA
jgi:hypothetical protein